MVDEPGGRDTNGDGGGGNGSQTIGFIPHSGTYLIVANTVSKGGTGAYTLSVPHP